MADAVASFVQMPDVRLWTPHLTLARQADVAASRIEQASPPLGGWEVRRYGLFESRGGWYQEIATFSAS
jgi:2'-5' RNA ligase